VACEQDEIRRVGAGVGAAFVAMGDQIAANGTTGLDQRLKTDEAAREVAARSVIEGTGESKFQTGKIIAAHAIALGVLGEREIKKTEQLVATEAAKDMAVAVKASDSVDNDDSGDFLATPPINIAALERRRAQQETAGLTRALKT